MIASAAAAAVSVLSTRRPIDTARNPAADASSYSASLKPPSGPISTQTLVVGASIDDSDRAAPGARINSVSTASGLLTKPVVESNRRVDERQARSSGLLTGTRCDFVPVIAAFFGAFTGELDHAVFGEHGRNALDAEFGRLLHDEVHALATRDALHQVDFQGGLGPRIDIIADIEVNAVFAELRYRGVPLGTLAVEQRDGIANPAAQNLAEVARAFAVELKPGAIDQLAGNK